MANVPLSGETGWILPVICGNDQSRDLRRINTTGKSVEIEKFVSTEQQLLRVNRYPDWVLAPFHPVDFSGGPFWFSVEQRRVLNYDVPCGRMIASQGANHENPLHSGIIDARRRRGWCACTSRPSRASQAACLFRR
jgi:hypothetical protein